MQKSHLRQSTAALLAALVLTIPYVALAESPMGTAMPMPAPIALPPLAPPGFTDSKASPLAAIKVTRDQAIAIAKQFFTIPDSLGNPNANVNQTRDGAAWQLFWQSGEKQTSRLNINVSVDAFSGEVINYSRYSSESDSRTDLAYTRDEAFTVALEWLLKLMPNYQEAFRLFDSPLNYGLYGPRSGYDFHWDRLVGNYAVQGEGIDLSINARTGSLESYSLSWRRSALFSDSAAVLDKAKAESIYRELVPMMLQYQHFQKPGTDEGEWRLAYRPQFGYYPTINMDGSLRNQSGGVLDMSILGHMQLVPASDLPYVKPSNTLTQEQALILAREVTGRSDEPTTSNYSESGQDQKVRAWQFGWYKEGELKGTERSTSITIDVERGIVTQFSNYGPYEPLTGGEQPKVSDGQARELAIAFLRTNRPDLAGNVMLQPEERYTPSELGPRPATLNMRFVQLFGGIPVSDNTAYVEIDLRTGEVRSFWGDSSRGEAATEPYPPATDLIGAAQAMAGYLTSTGIELMWSSSGPGPMGKFPGIRDNMEPVLVWAPARTWPTQFIDAKTGAPLDGQGRDLVEAAKRPTDIAGHFAQREIELLWARGVFELTEGKFRPDGSTTASEAARWLVLSRGLQPFMAYDFRGNFAGNASLAAKIAAAPEAAYFGAALQSGIILPGDFAIDAAPTSLVTREMFALWAARAMGYGAIAAMPNRIEMAFNDRSSIGDDYANAVAILNGLGIVKGDGHAFNPQQNLTRGAAARILFAVSTHSNR